MHRFSAEPTTGTTLEYKGLPKLPACTGAQQQEAIDDAALVQRILTPVTSRHAASEIADMAFKLTPGTRAELLVLLNRCFNRCVNR